MTETATDPTQVVPSEPTAEQLGSLTPDQTTTTETPPPSDEGATPDSEAAAPEPAPAPPSWASIHDPDELIDLPEIDERVNLRVSRRVEEQRQTDFTELKAFQEQLKGDAVMRQLEGTAGNLLEKMENGDYVGAESVIEKLKSDILDRYSPAHTATLEAKARQEAARDDILFALDEAKKLLPEKGRDALKRLVDNGEANWGSLFNLAKKEWTSPLQAQLDAKTQELEQYKLTTRKGQGLNLGDTGGGRGGMTYKQLMALSPDEYEAVPRETKQALFAENARAQE